VDTSFQLRAKLRRIFVSPVSTKANSGNPIIMKTANQASHKILRSIVVISNTLPKLSSKLTFIFVVFIQLTCLPNSSLIPKCNHADNWYPTYEAPDFAPIGDSTQLWPKNKYWRKQTISCGSLHSSFQFVSFALSHFCSTCFWLGVVSLWTCFICKQSEITWPFLLASNTPCLFLDKMA